MKTKICFKANRLCELLPDYELRKFRVHHEGEEYGVNKNTYYFCKPDVDEIKMYHSLFSDSMFITFKDGTTISAMGDNVNVDDLSIIRINNNDYVSPALIDDGTGEFIESNKKLVNWLSHHDVSIKDLRDDIVKFNIYEDIEYPGVPTPDFSFGHWSYSSKPLVLKEQEIESVLNSIDDKILRKKIECILYARVFKKI